MSEFEDQSEAADRVFHREIDRALKRAYHTSITASSNPHIKLGRQRYDDCTVVTVTGGHDHDEGYSHDTTVITIHLTAHWIKVERTSGGTSCDGRIEHHTDVTYDWNGEVETEDSYVYDQYAQMAGY